LDEGKIKELYDIFFTIDEHYFPNGNEWIAGETVTAADFAYVATISTAIVSFIFVSPTVWIVMKIV
jgi:glutathione S-transferase